MSLHLVCLIILNNWINTTLIAKEEKTELPVRTQMHGIAQGCAKIHVDASTTSPLKISWKERHPIFYSNWNILILLVWKQFLSWMPNILTSKIKNIFVIKAALHCPPSPPLKMMVVTAVLLTSATTYMDKPIEQGCRHTQKNCCRWVRLIVFSSSLCRSQSRPGLQS